MAMVILRNHLYFLSQNVDGGSFLVGGSQVWGSPTRRSTDASTCQFLAAIAFGELLVRIWNEDREMSVVPTRMGPQMPD